VSVEDPICTFDGDLDAAFYGSFLPVPSQDKFPAAEVAVVTRESLPGAIIPGEGRITINKGRERIQLTVTNHGDRDIQVRALPNVPPVLIGSKGGISLPFRRNQWLLGV